MSKDENRQEELERIRKWIEERRKGAVKDQGDKVSKKKEKKDKSLVEYEKKYLEPIKRAIKFEQSRASNTKSNNSDYGKIQLRLDYLNSIEWTPQPYEAIDLNKAKRILIQSHFGMNVLKSEILDYIIMNNEIGKVNGEVILFSGPPGTGKTSIARAIAKALNRPFHKLTLGGLSDDIYLKGASNQYASSKPGAIVDILYKEKGSKVVILLDEIDKLSSKHGKSDAASVLLDALDHDNAFVDRFLDVPVDLSNVVFLATANNVEDIPAPLLDRMNNIEIKPYSVDEKVTICKRYILRDLREEYNLKGKLRVNSDVIEAIVYKDSMNPGVRNLITQMKKICRYTTKVLNEGKKTVVFNREIAESINLIKPEKKMTIKRQAIGSVVTTSIDNATGKIYLTMVEALYNRATEEPTVIGTTRNIFTNEAIQLWHYIVAHNKAFNIDYEVVSKGAVTLNISSLNRFNYDSNNSLATFTAIFSSIKKSKIPCSHIAIGHVSLIGYVRSNETTEKHLSFALKSDVDLIVFPASEMQLAEKMNTKNKILCPVSHLSDMLKHFQFFHELNVIDSMMDEYNFKKMIDHHDAINKLSEVEIIGKNEAFKRHFNLPYTSAEQSLDELVALDDVKHMVKKIVAWREVISQRKLMKLKSKDIGLHMMFTGNPGTGKTTVAKLLGELLYKKNITKNDRFVEVTRDDLVGKYIGHTEEKVKSTVKRALGGILYIDEAHSLFNQSENDFGRIVISSLVKEMEEYRDNLIVILSGYKEEMNELICLNKGLFDRINYKIHFKDYHEDELLEVFEKLILEESYVAHENIKIHLYDHIKMMKEDAVVFSNARYIRNVFEKMKVSHAIRVSEIDEPTLSDYQYLEYYDLVNALSEDDLMTNESKQLIGFG